MQELSESVASAVASSKNQDNTFMRLDQNAVPGLV
jgi:hypothetical protein